MSGSDLFDVEVFLARPHVGQQSAEMVASRTAGLELEMDCLGRADHRAEALARFAIARAAAFRRVNAQEPDRGLFAVSVDLDRVAIHHAEEGDEETIANANRRRGTVDLLPRAPRGCGKTQ